MNTGRTTIATACPGDEDALVNLVVDQMQEHGISHQRNQIRPAIREIIEDEDKGLFLVARREAIIVGFAYLAFVWSLEHAGHAAWLEELYVVPGHREQGVGEALLHVALDETRARGCAAIDLEVDEAHQRAEHLYYRNGFMPLQRRRWVKRLDD